MSRGEEHTLRRTTFHRAGGYPIYQCRQLAALVDADCHRRSPSPHGFLVHFLVSNWHRAIVRKGGGFVTSHDLFFWEHSAQDGLDAAFTAPPVAMPATSRVPGKCSPSLRRPLPEDIWAGTDARVAVICLALVLTHRKKCQRAISRGLREQKKQKRESIPWQHTFSCSAGPGCRRRNCSNCQDKTGTTHRKREEISQRVEVKSEGRPVLYLAQRTTSWTRLTRSTKGLHKSEQASRVRE
jgi:hypothetical protein